MESDSDATERGHLAAGSTRTGSIGPRTSLKQKLLSWFLGVSLAPLIAVSLLSYSRATETLNAAAYRELTSSVQQKSTFISNWFEYRMIDVGTLAMSVDNGRFLARLREGFEKSGQDVGDFVGSFRWTQIAGPGGDDLRSFKRTYDYHDVFLIDFEGNILFSITEEDDLGTNLFDGPYADTHFGHAVRETLETGRLTSSDLEHYSPSNDMAAGFLVSIIADKDGGKRVWSQSRTTPTRSARA